MPVTVFPGPQSAPCPAKLCTVPISCFSVMLTVVECLCDANSSVDNLCVFSQPLFSTVEKSLSDVSTPTGTRPVPQAAHVPPKSFSGFVSFMLI